VVQLRLNLHHRDGRKETTSVRGDGPFAPDAILHLPEFADYWWKVRSLRWNGEHTEVVAELEPTDLPPRLLFLAK
jgi:hypothetical protein